MPYDNTNSGLLSRNQRKEKDTHPDYTGSINIDGKDYWLSAWVKEGREGTKFEGQKYFSLSVRAKDEERAQSRPARPAPRQETRQEPRRQPPATRSGSSFDGMDDDIPF